VTLKTCPVLLAWERDFSELVAETYGRPYRLQQQGDMLGQDSMIEFSAPTEQIWDEDEYLGVTFAEWLAAEPPAPGDWREEMRWHREFYPPIERVVNDLHARGLLAAGDYVLHVWW
jgi:hypothetical protein